MQVGLRSKFGPVCTKWSALKATRQATWCMAQALTRRIRWTSADQHRATSTKSAVIQRSHKISCRSLFLTCSMPHFHIPALCRYIYIYILLEHIQRHFWADNPHAFGWQHIWFGPRNYKNCHFDWQVLSTGTSWQDRNYKPSKAAFITNTRRHVLGKLCTHFTQSACLRKKEWKHCTISSQNMSEV